MRGGLPMTHKDCSGIERASEARDRMNAANDDDVGQSDCVSGMRFATQNRSQPATDTPREKEAERT